MIAKKEEMTILTKKEKEAVKLALLDFIRNNSEETLKTLFPPDSNDGYSPSPLKTAYWKLFF